MTSRVGPARKAEPIAPLGRLFLLVRRVGRPTSDAQVYPQRRSIPLRSSMATYGRSSAPT
jgi:hypothetical protein